MDASEEIRIPSREKRTEDTRVQQPEATGEGIGRERNGESGLDALQRQHSHRSCRGFPRSSSLSLRVYLHERQGSDLSFIRLAARQTPGYSAAGYLSVVSRALPNAAFDNALFA